MRHSYVGESRLKNDRSLKLVQQTLYLLHHLILPIPNLPAPIISSVPSISASQHPKSYSRTSPSPEPDTDDLPIGINLAARLHAASQQKEFNGIQHLFVSALGQLAYGDCGVEEGVLEEGEKAGWWDMQGMMGVFIPLFLVPLQHNLVALSVRLRHLDAGTECG